jgi:cellulose synthase/poly-beta-1,6-N-acetylglucosamine synthase-like glycosyltransferase
LRAAELPEYTILVPLYREAEELPHLVDALQRLDYPAEKLDIQFLVEAADTATRRAVIRHAWHLPCRVTVVPPGIPRTKPRALNVGLRQARGSIVTIFDAEDRPDPGQLRLAAETFAAAPPELAALQARLSIDHSADNWLTRMFAIEYACQFDHILPMVTSRGGLVLLGGTSNHFRTEALVRAGGWDPYNVTEDADLSVRLRRFGYRIATIDSETHEEAPVTIGAWLNQRSRWFKGYMQTWLVHNRHPLRLVREIGWRDTMLMHLFIVGALTAAAAHLVFVVQLALTVAGAAPLLFGGSAALSALQLAAFAAGYGASFALGVVSVRSRGDPRLNMRLVLWFPVYWLLMGCALVQAVYDLARRPHHWRKTTHGIAIRPDVFVRTFARAAGARRAAAPPLHPAGGD